MEPAREGEDPSECSACKSPDDAYIWVSDRWRVRAMDRPSGLPMVLVLEARSHLDLGDLPNLLAAELGVMTVRLERAVRSLDGVERVHVNRWGDNAAHLHLWFLARPTGYLQLRGSFLSMWDDILEPVAEDVWRENLALVAAWLADFGGRAVAEPPRIEWHAPSHFDEITAGGRVAEAPPSAAASGSVVPTLPAKPSTDSTLPGAPAGSHSGPSVPSAGPTIPAPAGPPAIEGLTLGAILGNVTSSSPIGAVSAIGAASLNGVPSLNGTSSPNGSTPPLGTSSPNGTSSVGGRDIGGSAPIPGLARDSGIAIGSSTPPAFGLTPPPASASGTATSPAGSDATVAQGLDTKTFPGNGRLGAPSEASGIDGEGWGLSPDEIAASDILSR